MPAAECIGEAPTYWDSSIIFPNSILYSLLITTFFLVGFIVYYNYTFNSRNVKMSEIEYLNKANDDYKKGRKPSYVIPGILHYAIMYLFVNFISSNYFYAAFYYIYLAFDDETFACYLQWYSPGSFLYGNFSFIIIGFVIVWLLWISFSIRPNVVKKQVLRFSEVLELLVNFQRLNTTDLNMLYIPAFDGKYN